MEYINEIVEIIAYPILLAILLYLKYFSIKPDLLLYLLFLFGTLDYSVTKKNAYNNPSLEGNLIVRNSLIIRYYDILSFFYTFILLYLNSINKIFTLIAAIGHLYGWMSWKDFNLINFLNVIFIYIFYKFVKFLI